MKNAYADYALPFVKQVIQYGRADGPWGHVVNQPNADGIHFGGQFFDNALKPTSLELFELMDRPIVDVKGGKALANGAIYNLGFGQPDGSVAKISVIQEILSDPTGSYDITVVGGPQTFALAEVPDYPYDLWTLAEILNPDGSLNGRYSHSNHRTPPSDILNPYWLGPGSATQSCIGHHESWSDGSTGKWAETIRRQAYLAESIGAIWYVKDEIATDPNLADYGMRMRWSYQ